MRLVVAASAGATRGGGLRLLSVYVLAEQLSRDVRRDKLKF